MRSTFAALCATLLLANVRADAALEWEQTKVQIEAGPLDERVDAIFRFKNIGANPVTIAETHASCGCTVPSLDKKTFAPGERGEMRVVYTIGEGTVGKQEKTVTVQTADTPADIFHLTLSVDVPGLWDVQPRFLMWQVDETSTAKTIKIRALHPELAKPVSVEARDARFAATIAPSPEAPDIFVVTVTPESTDAPMFTSVLVATNTSTEKKRVVQLYAVVR